MQEIIRDKVNKIIEEYSHRGIELGLMTQGDEYTIIFDIDQYGNAIKKKVIDEIKKTTSGRPKFIIRTGYILRIEIFRGYFNMRTINKVKEIVDYLDSVGVRSGYKVDSTGLIIVISIRDFLDVLTRDIEKRFEEDNKNVIITHRIEYTKYVGIIKWKND